MLKKNVKRFLNISNEDGCLNSIVDNEKLIIIYL
jgi:hypothetical protein